MRKGTSPYDVDGYIGTSRELNLLDARFFKHKPAGAEDKVIVNVRNG